MELHPSFHHCLSPEDHLLFWFLCPLLEVPPKFSSVQDSSFTIFSPDPSPELHSMSFSWAVCLDTQLLFPRQLAGNKIHPITSPTGSFFSDCSLSVSSTHCLQGFFFFFLVLIFFKLCCAPKCHLPLISDFLTYGLHPFSSRPTTRAWMIEIASEVSRLLECTALLCILEKGSLFSEWMQSHARAHDLASGAQSGELVQSTACTTVHRDPRSEPSPCLMFLPLQKIFT